MRGRAPSIERVAFDVRLRKLVNPLRHIFLIFAGALISCGDTPDEEDLGGVVRDRHRVVTEQLCPIHKTPLWKVESFGEIVCYSAPYGAWIQSVDIPNQFPHAIIGERNLRKDHSHDADFPMYHLACVECEKASSESWTAFAAVHTNQPAEQAGDGQVRSRRESIDFPDPNP